MSFNFCLLTSFLSLKCWWVGCEVIYSLNFKLPLCIIYLINQSTATVPKAMAQITLQLSPQHTSHMLSTPEDTQVLLFELVYTD